VLPVISTAETVYGPEAIEWHSAVAGVVTLLEAACQTIPVSRFTLDIAVEVARGTANSARNAVREKGPSKAAENAELAFAAAAFAVDVLRTVPPPRAAAAAVTCLRNALASGEVPEQLVAEDLKLLDRLAGVDGIEWDPTDSGVFGELWPFGEPAWWSAGRARLRELEPGLPKLLRLPGW
jgi:hypothetical protein